MSAAEYLRQLQKQHPVPKPDISDIEALRRAAEARGIDFDKAVREFEETQADVAGNNLEVLRPFMSADLQQRIASGQVAAGTLGLESFDLHAVEIETDCWAIVFYTGFTQFLYQAARSVARLFPTPATAGQDRDALLNETAAALTRLLWYYNASSAWHPAADPIEPSQLEIAGVLAGAADEFFLAHELGHVVTHVSGIEATARRIGPLPSASPERQVEFACDGYALRLLLDKAATMTGEFDRDFAVAGAEFGLQLLRLMSRFGMAFAATHPAAAERIAYLRRLHSEWTAAEGTGRDSGVGPARRRDAGQLAVLVEALLERCVGLMNDGLRLDNVDEDEVEALMPRIEAEATQAAPHAMRGGDTLTQFMIRLRTFGSVQSVAVALARLCALREERGQLDPQVHVDEDILADELGTGLLTRASRQYYEMLRRALD